MHVDEYSCMQCENRLGISSKCCCPEDRSELKCVKKANLRKRINLDKQGKLCRSHLKKLEYGLVFGNSSPVRCCAPFHVDLVPSRGLRPIPHSWKQYFKEVNSTTSYRTAQRICWDCYLLCLEVLHVEKEEEMSDKNVFGMQVMSSPELQYTSPRKWASNIPHRRFGSRNRLSSSTWSLPALSQKTFGRSCTSLSAQKRADSFEHSPPTVINDTPTISPDRERTHKDSVRKRLFQDWQAAALPNETLKLLPAEQEEEERLTKESNKFETDSSLTTPYTVGLSPSSMNSNERESKSHESVEPDFAKEWEFAERLGSIEESQAIETLVGHSHRPEEPTDVADAQETLSNRQTDDHFPTEPHRSSDQEFVEHYLPLPLSVQTQETTNDESFANEALPIARNLHHESTNTTLSQKPEESDTTHVEEELVLCSSSGQSTESDSDDELTLLTPKCTRMYSISDCEEVLSESLRSGPEKQEIPTVREEMTPGGTELAYGPSKVESNRPEQGDERLKEEFTEELRAKPDLSESIAEQELVPSEEISSTTQVETLVVKQSSEDFHQNGKVADIERECPKIVTRADGLKHCHKDTPETIPTCLFENQLKFDQEDMVRKESIPTSSADAYQTHPSDKEEVECSSFENSRDQTSQEECITIDHTNGNLSTDVLIHNDFLKLSSLTADNTELTCSSQEESSTAKTCSYESATETPTLQNGVKELEEVINTNAYEYGHTPSANDISQLTSDSHEQNTNFRGLRIGLETPAGETISLNPTIHNEQPEIHCHTVDDPGASEGELVFEKIDATSPPSKPEGSENEIRKNVVEIFHDENNGDNRTRNCVGHNEIPRKELQSLGTEILAENQNHELSSEQENSEEFDHTMAPQTIGLRTSRRRRTFGEVVEEATNQQLNFPSRRNNGRNGLAQFRSQSIAVEDSTTTTRRRELWRKGRKLGVTFAPDDANLSEMKTFEEPSSQLKDGAMRHSPSPTREEEETEEDEDVSSVFTDIARTYSDNPIARSGALLGQKIQRLVRYARFDRLKIAGFITIAFFVTYVYLR